MNSSRESRSLAAMLLIACIGCNTDTLSPEQPTENVPTSTGAVVISAQPIARLSERLPQDLLPLEVADATRFPDGRFAYVSGRDLMFRMTSAAGREAPVSFGRDGEGPGEFTSLKWIEQCGADRLYTWDFLQRRIGVFTLAGEFLHQFRGLSLTRLYCDDAGNLMALEMPREDPGPPGSNVEPVLARIVFLDDKGDVLTELDDFPMGRNRVLGPVTTGGFIGENVVLGTAEQASIQLLQRNGTLVREIALGDLERTITPALYQAELDRIVAQTHPDAHERIREMLSTVPMPASLPAYRSIVTDKARLAWITLSSLGDGKTRLIAVDASAGSLIGTVEFPFEAELLEAGSGYLLLLASSDEGDDVLVYEITVGE
jgi:hypothetical protein